MSKESTLERVLITQEELQQRIAELGATISRDYAERELAMVAILNGSFIFAADLLRAVTIEATIDFMAISSYANQPASGVVRITKDLGESLLNRHVLLVEDIIDTGLTANYLLRVLRERKPASLEVCDDVFD